MEPMCQTVHHIDYINLGDCLYYCYTAALTVLLCSASITIIIQTATNILYAYAWVNICMWHTHYCYCNNKVQLCTMSIYSYNITLEFKCSLKLEKGRDYSRVYNYNGITLYRQSHALLLAVIS